MTPVPFFSFAAMNSALGEAPFEVFRRFWDQQWYILGASVTQFEEAYALWNGTQHCIGVANGLDALHLALRALQIGRTLGDDREVITGLSGGDRVVLAPADDLADGARVRIASDKDDADASNE